MNTSCQITRERLLADPEFASSEFASSGGHLRDCANCSAWWERTRGQVNALTGLERLAAPAELTAALNQAFPSSGTPIERALRSLPRVAVPSLLDDLVLEPSPLGQSPSSQLVRALSRPRVPAVLDRLVAEELASPARHRVERFAGDLERATVPTELDQHPIRELTRPGIASKGFRLLAPLAALAAGLFLWANLGSQVTEPSEPSYPFRVVRATSPDQLSSLTRTFLTGMTGGGSLMLTDQNGEGE